MKRNPHLILILLLLILPFPSFAQSDLDRVVRGGEILLSGLTILRAAKSDGKADSPFKTVCVKNKRPEKITFRITGKDANGAELKKELVVPKDGKECVLELPKGIYYYEILLATGEIYKKGEYRLDDEITITVKE